MSFSTCFPYEKVIFDFRKQNKQAAASASSFPTLSRRSTAPTLATGENRFIFKRRLFKNTREISQDPVEVNMLYAQAVYNVVKVRFCYDANYFFVNF